MGGSEGLKKGLWTGEEDRILMEHIKVHGKGRWNRVAKITGLKRCGKSCRLRWMNYLRPEIKLGAFSDEEDELIIRLHRLLGNRWSLIAGRVPGRTDNQVKNHWNTHLKKKVSCIKNSMDTNAGMIKVADQVSSNTSFNKEENNIVPCSQEINNVPEKIEDQKTKCIQEAVDGDEGLEDLFWQWSNNGIDGRPSSLMELSIDGSNDPWSWIGSDLC